MVNNKVAKYYMTAPSKIEGKINNEVKCLV